MKDQRICIIGSGLAGLTTAVALSKLNLKIDVIAKNIEEDLNSCRTIAISQSNYEYIKHVKPSIHFAGIWACPFLLGGGCGLALPRFIQNS